MHACANALKWNAKQIHNNYCLSVSAPMRELLTSDLDNSVLKFQNTAAEDPLHYNYVHNIYILNAKNWSGKYTIKYL